MAESPSDAEADARGVERRLRPTNWRQIKLGTGTTNLSHTHPVLVAAQAAMLDHLLKGRFLFGVSPGALESDAEALGIHGLDRNEMFAESIGHIIDIWRGEPPYDLEGRHWKISTRETLHPEIGVGPIPKPYQKPHPPILATVVAPYSKGVIEMGKKGFLPISAKDRRNNRPICVVRGVLVWSLSGSLPVRARTFRDRSDAIWSRLQSEHDNTGVGRGAWEVRRGGAVAHPWAQSGHVQ